MKRNFGGLPPPPRKIRQRLAFREVKGVSEERQMWIEEKGMN